MYIKVEFSTRYRLVKYILFSYINEIWSYDFILHNTLKKIGIGDTNYTECSSAEGIGDQSLWPNQFEVKNEKSKLPSSPQTPKPCPKQLHVNMSSTSSRLALALQSGELITYSH